MKNIFVFILLALAASSCKKTETPAVPVRLDFIASDISKDWFIQNVVITTTVNGNERKLNLLLECESDDRWTFTRAGRLIVNDNLSRCQGKPPERLNTFWVADDTFDNITFSNWRLKDAENLMDVKFAVSNLSDTTMTLSGGAIIPNTKAITVNYRTRKL